MTKGVYREAICDKVSVWGGELVGRKFGNPNSVFNIIFAIFAKASAVAFIIVAFVCFGVGV